MDPGNSGLLPAQGFTKERVRSWQAWPGKGPCTYFWCMTSAANYTKIYTDLGYLFYSMAAGDGTVRKAERTELKRLVDKYWLPMEDSTDQFGTDAGHYIDISFDFAESQEMNAEEAYAQFEDGFRTRKAHYNDKIKALTLKTVKAIADAFHGTNKEEQAMIDRVAKLLEG